MRRKMLFLSVSARNTGTEAGAERGLEVSVESGRR